MLNRGHVFSAAKMRYRPGAKHLLAFTIRTRAHQHDALFGPVFEDHSVKAVFREPHKVVIPPIEKKTFESSDEYMLCILHAVSDRS